MIAATDPQEFVPGGRQQASRHPGPIKHHDNHNALIEDDHIRRDFARVTLAEVSSPNETWITRAVPYHSRKEPFRGDKTFSERDRNDCELSRAEVQQGESRTRNRSSLLGDNRNKKDPMRSNCATNKSNVTSSTDPSSQSYVNNIDSDISNMEEELYVRDGLVIWSRGLPHDASKNNNRPRTLVRSYASDRPVKQALWCTFYRERPLFTAGTSDGMTDGDNDNEPIGEPIECVVILDATRLRTYTVNGEDFVTVLPMPVKKMWPSKFGLILERDCTGDPSSSSNMKDDHLHSISSSVACSTIPPTLYHLGHPLDDITPLAATIATSTSSHHTVQQLDDRSQRMVYVSWTPSLCVLYDEQSQQHSVYRLRRVRRSETYQLLSQAQAMADHEEDGTRSSYVGSCATNASAKNKMRLSSLLESCKINVPIGISPFSSKGTSRSSASHEVSRTNSITTAPSRTDSPLVPTGSTNSPWLLKSSRLYTSLRNTASSAASNQDSVYLLESQAQQMHSPFQLTPKLCLEYLWTDTTHLNPVAACSATKVFLVDDMAGQWNLSYYIPTTRQLCTVKLDLSNQNQIGFGSVKKILCKDAIAINHLHMMAILEYTGNIVLYSGLYQVGKLHIGGVLAQHTPTPFVYRSTVIKYASPSPKYPKRSSLLPHCGTPMAELRIDLLSPVLPDSVKRPHNRLHIPMQPDFYHNSAGDIDGSSSTAPSSSGPVTPHHHLALVQRLNHATPKRLPMKHATPTLGVSHKGATPAESKAAGQATAAATQVQLTDLRDCVGYRLTLQYTDGTYYSVHLPSYANCRLVRDAIAALRAALPAQVTLEALTRWYTTRNAPGPQTQGAEQEWNMFTDLLRDLIGYTEDSSDDSSSSYNTDDSKRKRRISIGSNSDYSYVLHNNQHTRMSQSLFSVLNLKQPELCNELEISESKKMESSTSTRKSFSIKSSSMLFPYIRVIHFVLHLLYEDIKLNIYRKCDVRLLATFLSKLAADLELKDHQAYYFRECCEVCPIIKHNEPTVNEIDRKLIILWPEFTNKPSSVLTYLEELLSCGGQLNEEHLSYPCISQVNNRSREVILLCGSYICGMQNENIDMPMKNLIKVIAPNGERTVQINQLKGYKDDLKQSLTERMILLMTHMNFTQRLLESYSLSIRFILFDALWRCRENPPNNWPSEAYQLLQRSDLAAQANLIRAHHLSLSRRPLPTDQAPDTLTSTTPPATCSPTHTSPPIFDGLQDVLPAHSPVLRFRFPRDVRVGDARSWLQSAVPVQVVVTQRPDVTDHDYIEEKERYLFAITARTMALPVGRGMFSLRTHTPLTTTPLPCPDLDLTGRSPPHGATVDLSHIDVPPHMNTWPLFHNGVANGLRVSALARGLDSSWIVFNRPQSGGAGAGTQVEWQLEHAGLLLALGLNGHLARLGVLSRMDYLVKKVNEMTSMAVLLGLGVSFRGTCNISVTKMLSVHCEALLPPTSMELDVPQHLQVAALLGIGFVYQGTSHRHMTEVLLNEIGRPPGPEMENCVDRESYGLTAGLALGLVALRQGSQPCGLADLNVPETLHYYMVGGNKRPLAGAQKDKYKVPSFQIKEGTSVNLDITAPGATLALGLMYLATNNKAIADWMDPPKTQYLLDFVRPDLLMLRILSRSLIMWDDIRPNTAWVKSQVPDSILPFCMVTPMDLLDIDYEAMNQAYCNIVAGACFAIGLRYAGTANSDAHSTLLDFCHMFISLTTKSLAELAGKPTIETCLNTVLLADAMVMAGTGNLDIMRIVRHLRKRVGVSTCAVVTYGSHLAVHMALGLLFLGGGRYSLSNSPSSVAALICALYPKFPTHSNDNRYHLQAFRHLYVLAAEPRLLIPKDITRSHLCYVSIRVTHMDGTAVNIRGPDLLPDLTTLCRVAVNDPRYWPIVFERGRNWEQLKTILSNTGLLHVRQRAGCLAYTEDSLGLRSNLARTRTEAAILPWQPQAADILAFSSDVEVRHYVEAFLLQQQGRREKGGEEVEERLRRCWTRAMYECVTKDKVVVVALLGSIIKIIQDLRQTPHLLQLRHFKLISSFVQRSHLKSTIADIDTIVSFQQQINEILDEWKQSLKPHIISFLSGTEIDHSNPLLVMQRLAAFILFYDLPYKVEAFTNPLQLLCQLSSNPNTIMLNEIMELIL